MKSRAARLTAIGAASLCLVLSACGGGSGSTGEKPTIKVGFFSGGSASPENIVYSDPALRSSVAAKIKMVPITAGLAALSEMRGGAFDIVSSVGNPPVVSAIAAHTPLRVVWVESYDGAELVVHPSIRTNADLKGKTLGDLQGSSEDFELRGWLKHEGLLNDVKVVGFPSDAAAGAAWRSGKIDAAYVMINVALGLKQKGGRRVVTAAQIARLGFPSLNVTAASEDLVKNHPEVVQQYVCAEKAAQDLLTKGPRGKRTKYVTASAKELGAAPGLVMKSTNLWPIMPTSQVRGWFGGTDPVRSDSPIVKAYVLTADFLKGLGTLPQSPARDDILASIDPKFTLAALAGKC